jgi:hypothetical protein
MGNRFLPSLPSDLKVAALLRIIAKENDASSTVRNKIPPRIMEQEGVSTQSIDKMPPLAQQMFVSKLNEAYTDFDSQTVELEFPDRLLITQNDLPKERAGDDGWKNGSMIGAIVADLNLLFEMPKE